MDGGRFFPCLPLRASDCPGKSTSLTVLGWSEGTPAHTVQAYSGTGHAESAKGALEDDLWIWMYDSMVQGKVFRDRFTMKVLSPHWIYHQL
jgi:hypothetical protein